MKRFGVVFLIFCLMAFLPAYAESAHELSLVALSAGKADALILTMDGRHVLIDAGYARSMGKLRAAFEQLQITELDAVILTHTDGDHADGLDWLAGSDIPVGEWYASAMYTGVKTKKHPAVRAAAQRNQSVIWLQRGDSLRFGSAEIAVLAPETPNSNNENDNSLVLMVSHPDGRILLTGDMEFGEEGILLASGDDLRCDVLKIPNHADDDTCSDALLRAASPSLAVISTDSEEKPETPDRRILAGLAQIGAEAVQTQECSGWIEIRLEGGSPSYTRTDLPNIDAALRVIDVLPGDDTITLRNDGAAQALSGWYLYSSKGGELFLFPQDAMIGAGETLTVGTLSSPEGSFDLLWNDKKVIHTSKTDSIALYAPNGLLISQMRNGF
ncbi:MAG: MBL fold metallo-hydrolase [Clostridia bacterium]|nr:MBL fold metallo-hydrolase [Clostridia bacterium]